MILQLTSGTSGAIVATSARIFGTAVLAGFLAATVALVYRWYVRERVPAGLPVLVGLSGVAVVAGTTSLLADAIAPTQTGMDELAALFNVVTFVVGGVGAHLGTRVGDALGVDLFAATGGREVDGELGTLVRTVGRVISVTVPDEIDDVVGYDPVPEATKEKLAGHTFLFPRRLTQGELRDRFVSRLKTDYGVGHVDVEFDDAGSIEYLAVGSRAAGIGPTLPPATNAVAIRADPAHAASAGDLVQVWQTDPMARVLTAELRGVAGEIVTIAIDGADTPKLDPTQQYKLVTLPVQDRPDREFASLLRGADETLATITVEQGSTLDGQTVADCGVTIAAISRDDERPVALPVRDRSLQAADVIYAIGTPESLRKLEIAARATDSGGQEVDDDRVQATGTDESAATAEATHSAKQNGDDVDGEGSVDGEGTVETDDGEVPSGAAFADVEELPGIDPEQAMDDATGDDEIPAGDAFPDTDELPGSDALSENGEGGDHAQGDDGTAADDSERDPAAAVLGDSADDIDPLFESDADGSADDTIEESVDADGDDSEAADADNTDDPTTEDGDTEDIDPEDSTVESTGPEATNTNDTDAEDSGNADTTEESDPSTDDETTDDGTEGGDETTGDDFGTLLAEEAEVPDEDFDEDLDELLDDGVTVDDTESTAADASAEDDDGGDEPTADTDAPGDGESDGSEGAPDSTSDEDGGDQTSDEDGGDSKPDE